MTSSLVRAAAGLILFHACACAGQAIPSGLVVTESMRGFADTLDALNAAIDDSEAGLSVIGRVNHTAGAESRALVLLPTYATHVSFATPDIDQSLVDASVTSLIDIPHTILVWEDDNAVVRLGYNAPAYLQTRHGLNGVDDELATVGAELARLASAATGVIVTADAGVVDADADIGLVTVTTNRSVDDVYDAIVTVLTNAEPVNVIFEVDRGDARLVVFGNPSLGTLLMQEQRTVAVNLPQRIIVYADGDQTAITYNDPAFLVSRHNIVGLDDTVGTLSGALGNFASAGAGTNAPAPTEEMPSSATTSSATMAPAVVGLSMALRKALE